MTEIVLALRSIRVCGWCEDQHLRPYPEQPDVACIDQGCECWCKLGFVEVER